jgi:menaquinone-dependent protoporphyrinogen oxidase
VARVLIPYGTTEGQTAKIAEVIAEVLRDRGHEAVSVDIKSLVDPAFDRCDAVVIGASIHMGKHDKHVVEFVQKNRDTLERLPSAFFRSASPPKATPRKPKDMSTTLRKRLGGAPTT